MPPAIEAPPAAPSRRKMRGALAALARHGDQVDGTAKKDSFSADGNSCAYLGYHGIRPSSSRPNGIAVTQSAQTSSSPGTLDYAPPPPYYAGDTSAEDDTGTREYVRRKRSEEFLCSAPSLPPPPTYEEAMSTCSASRASLSSTTHRKSSRSSYEKRMSSLKTASTTTMCSFNDDEDVGATAPEAFNHDWNKEAIPSNSSPPLPSLGDREPIHFTGCLNDCQPNLPSSSSSSSRDASPIARRRPHHDSLVSTAHSLASADSVRAELERIQNLDRNAPPIKSFSSRRTTKPKVSADQDVNFRGYSNRRRSSSSVGGLSAGPTGYGGGGGSVSSLSHFTSVSRGSFSSIPRMILKDNNKEDDVSYDPFSYNFVDSDSDSDVDADHLENKLHTIRVEQLKIDLLKAQIDGLAEEKSPPPLTSSNGKKSPSNTEAKKPCSENTTTSQEVSQPKDDNETSPNLSQLDGETKYLLAMGPRQERAELSPHPSISSNTSSSNRDTKQRTHTNHKLQDEPLHTPTEEDRPKKEPGASNDDVMGMARLPMRRKGSWRTALGA